MNYNEIKIIKIKKKLEFDWFHDIENKSHEVNYGEY